MKVTRPAVTVDACDLCHREGGVLDICIRCGREYCTYGCGPYVPGCMIPVDVCKECDDDGKVQAIADRYAPELVKLRDARDAEIAALDNPKPAGVPAKKPKPKPKRRSDGTA